jgi:hypothetical protein
MSLVVLLACATPWLAPAQTPVRFPLRVAADGRHLEDVQGQAFLLQGDAAWSLLVKLSKAEVLVYLDDRRQRGFTAVLANLIERGFGGPENAEGEPPFVPADEFLSPNPAYFEHADWVIDRAAERGLLVLLPPAYLGYNCGAQGWCQQMLDQPVSSMLAYGRYLGDRYASRKNIVWVHGGDTDAATHGAAAHVNAIANGIRERAPGHLHTAHCSRRNSAIDCYDEPWLDLNTTYSNCNNTLADLRRDHDRVPTQSFFYIEGSYENETASLSCLIDQAAWSLLGGAFGHVFGNSPIWRFGAGWEAALSSAGSLAMGHLTALWRSRAWFRLEPDTSGEVLVADPEGDAVAARTSDGESALVYLPSSRTVSVNLQNLAGEQVQAWWFDPASGTASAIGSFAGSGAMNFSAPGRRVLVLDDASAGLPAPGTLYDRDGDGLADPLDNCPSIANAGQRDAGGIGTSTPDGIGDACQCGDVNDSGLVTSSDGLTIGLAALNLGPFTATSGATVSVVTPKIFLVGKCDVNSADGCSSADALYVNRAALGLPPPLAHDCPGEVLP